MKIAALAKLRSTVNKILTSIITFPRGLSMVEYQHTIYRLDFEKKQDAISMCQTCIGRQRKIYIQQMQFFRTGSTQRPTKWFTRHKYREILTVTSRSLVYFNAAKVLERLYAAEIKVTCLLCPSVMRT